MKTVTIDQPQFTAAGISCTVAGDGTSAALQVPNPSGDKPMSVTIPVSGGSLQLLPDRSFMHRAILQLLGIPV